MVNGGKKYVWDGGNTQAFLDLHCPNGDRRCFNITSILFLFSDFFCLNKVFIGTKLCDSFICFLMVLNG